MQIEINGTPVVCSHAIKTNPQTNHTAIHVTVSAEDLTSTHVLSIGAIDKPIDAAYGAKQLQADLDEFRKQSAEMLESKLRARKLAKEVI